MNQQWLAWARKLQSISQTGLHFNQNPFDAARYREIQSVAVEMMAAYSDSEPEYIQNLFDTETGYATPKVEVRGVVFQEDSLLMVKERMDGKWTIPGGWADINESPSEAVVREIREESGYQVRCIKLLGVYDRAKHPHEPPCPYHVYKIVFLCELMGGTPVSSIETEQVGFFRENDIPELSLARITPGQITRFFTHHQDISLPTDFD